jgi:hypothetical protein
LAVSRSKLVAAPPAVIRPDFRPRFLDFARGIHMGNLEPNQRITQILKAHLDREHGTRFVTDRWGRGVYWQWICWLPVANRQAKPISNDVNFGCAKFYISINTDDRTFEAGLQVERAPTRAGASWVRAREDWDIFRLMAQLRRSTPLAAELARLVRQEEFTVRAGPFGHMTARTSADYSGPATLARACRSIPADEWGGFQLCYVFAQNEIQAMTGDEIVGAISDIFDEVTAAANLVMTVACLQGRPLTLSERR